MANWISSSVRYRATTSTSITINPRVGGLLTSSSFAPEVDFGMPGWMHIYRSASRISMVTAMPDIAVVGELPSYMAIFQNTATPGSFTSGSFTPPIVTFGTGLERLEHRRRKRPGRRWAPGCRFLQLLRPQHPDLSKRHAMFSTPPVAPSIICSTDEYHRNHPAMTAMFNVVATGGTPPPNYQWSFDGTNIVGATNATLTLTNVLPAQAGNSRRARLEQRRLSAKSQTPGSRFIVPANTAGHTRTNLQPGAFLVGERGDVQRHRQRE